VLSKQTSLLWIGILLAPLSLAVCEAAAAALASKTSVMTTPRERFSHAVGLIDRLNAAERSNKLDVSHLFRELLPQTEKISDHVSFFREIGRDPIRVRANNKNYIYFSFPVAELRKLGARHVVRGDILVISYEGSDLSDDAQILAFKATLVNGSFL
jgi:hypothetical protein